MVQCQWQELAEPGVIRQLVEQSQLRDLNNMFHEMRASPGAPDPGPKTLLWLENVRYCCAHIDRSRR